ncbi:MAG: hypothetical protein FWE37_04460 [Spirochaetaceae bacterium]|nr:hypothetical protein [Spirochaetaceae bacterium]
MNTDKLIAWFSASPPLAWETEGLIRDGYQIWLLEVMCQQTTVATVSKRFALWLKQFPTIEALIAAGEAAVLRAWEGLGYYSRARNLYKTACLIGNKAWPANEKELLALPGLGPYTAKALLARIHNLPVLAVDANIKRILMRYLAKETINLDDEKSWQAGLSEGFKQYGGYIINHALLRLGQLVCKAQKPLCPECPLNESCLAYQKGLTKVIPPRKQKEVTALSALTAVFYDPKQQLLLIEKRGDKEIGSGLYALPRYNLNELEALQNKYGAALGLPVKIHNYTMYREKLLPYQFNINSKEFELKNNQFFVSLDTLDAYTFLSVYRKIITIINR